MTELGLDIHEEILVRLHVNDIIRCKSVCKSWYSLISSPRFVKSQLKYSSKTKYTNEIGDTRITMPSDDCVYLRTHAYQLIGSSNGLVCICLCHTYFFVVNPSTREVKKLKASPQVYQDSWSERVSGFGYDSSIDDYKVVIGFSNDNKLSFKVLNLKSNVWRSVAVESGYDNYLNRKGILCNGAIHWISSNQNDKQVIVSFDLSKEVLKEIPQPNLVLCQWKLGTVKDCLCIFRCPDINFRKHFTKFEIWVMTNYNVQESWRQYLPPPGYDADKNTIEDTTERKFFYGHVHIWLLEEGSPAPVLVRSVERPGEFGHFRLSTNSECNYNYDEHVFVKSLVSPHGMYDGDSDGDGDGNINDSGNGGRLKRKRKD